MRVLVVQNYNDTGLGQVGTALDEAGAGIDIRNAHRGEALPETADDHDALVVLGGGQNALDDAFHPYFPTLLGLMRSFVEGDKAVLGICLGSQLLARAYRARNQIGGAEEFGWHQVRLTSEAAGDPVLGGVPEEFPIFQWHDDTFSLPEGAVRLAGNAVAVNQAFRIGRAGYGIQFHFEADRTLVREWNGAFAEAIADRHPNWSTVFEEEATRHGPLADATGLAIARAWVRLAGASKSNRIVGVSNRHAAVSVA
jgi:GMP synthase-like glutamine amidotransferase